MSCIAMDCDAVHPLVDRRLTNSLVEGRALFLLKMALTLDGKISILSPGNEPLSKEAAPLYLSNQPSLQLVQHLRHQLDGLMIGSGTLRADNPRLTCRIAGGNDPWKIIVSSSGDLPVSATVFEESPQRTIIATTRQATAHSLKALEEKGVSIIRCTRDASGKVLLVDLAKQLADRHIKTVLLEGGSRLAAAALAAELVDRVLFFYAPFLMGEGAAVGEKSVSAVAEIGKQLLPAIKLTGIKSYQLDDNVLIDGYPVYKRKIKVHEESI